MEMRIRDILKMSISLRNEWEIIYKNRENPILVDLKNYLSFTNVIEVFVKFVVLYQWKKVG